ncbi:ABC transporter permease [Plebeiibacterium marinum]|uniref:ABC transporter permease n=1 Tax=Plebeiibacterium marinum TaxID=2992111 RepID=A0AAE3MB42_9BACT|nr:ABC transporter permease [Plebeiobacterium marinum]MCW3804364.1 ABC transporter permease [Plebeiobacterium marinum]
MNKILLIINREYLTRVRKKSFIIMTLLSPLIFAGMIVVPGWLNTQKDTKEKIIAIEDMTGLYQDVFENTDYIKYQYQHKKEAIEKKEALQKGFEALLVINSNLLQNPSDVQLISEGQITMNVQNNIKHQLNTYLRNEKLSSYKIDGLDEKIKEVNNLRVDLQTIRLDEDGKEKQSSAMFAMIIGMVSALLIYMFMLMYGTQVMRGVIEEKTNRIVEVMISSVKPFQLMMGKIIGIGLVALTQFGLWVILTLAVIFTLQNFVFNPEPQQIQQTMEMAQNNQISQASQTQEAAAKFNEVMTIIEDANIAGIIALFLFYFIGGYLIYSALFAAIGSAIDNETETQQFVMPILLPLILSIYVAMAAFNNPHGDIAFWFSVIPFTSPVVMMSRIPFDVPTWELVLSMAILACSFLILTWFAGRVYRTGILMYGKKVSYKEIWKWFIQAGK